jgi:pimeloyl-ACP methyl ester carboxylesterase
MTASESKPAPANPTLPQEPIDWLTVPSASALVQVGDRRVHLIAQGPPRKPGSAVVICESGLGHPGVVWGAVQSRCAPFVRTYAYDRAGYRQSDPQAGDKPRSAAVIARELSGLLEAAGIDGPYILAGHSFGGVLVREFIELRNEDVAGVVFVDVVTERSHKESPTPEDEYGALLDGINIYEVMGTAATHQLTPEEWDDLMVRGPNEGATVRAELSAFGNETERELAAKDQFARRVMGNKPVVVVKGDATMDMKACARKGIAAGNGTEEQRKIVLDYLETAEGFRERHQRELLQLSTNSRWVVAKHGGHNVHFTEPDLIVDEIRIIMQRLYGEV